MQKPCPSSSTPSTNLVEEVESLKRQLEQVKLELKLERQNKFTTSKESEDESAGEHETPANPSAADQSKKKRGAPQGHLGWFRPTPTEFDWDEEVPAPSRCPHCQGNVTAHEEMDPIEHLQKDVLDGVYRVVCYRHTPGRCDDCGAWMQQPGEGELLGSRIGPHLRSIAIYLRNVIGISYHKVPMVIEEMFQITFTPAALIGFETMLADKAG